MYLNSNMIRTAVACFVIVVGISLYLNPSHPTQSSLFKQDPNPLTNPKNLLLTATTKSLWQQLQQALGIKNEALRQTEIQRIFEQWRQQDAAVALQHAILFLQQSAVSANRLAVLMAFPAMERTQLMNLLVHQVEPTDPLIGDLIRLRAQLDPIVTMAWVYDSHLVNQQGLFALAAFQGWLAVNPEQAIDYFLQQQNTYPFFPQVTELMALWSEQDALSAAVYILGGELKTNDRVVSQALMQLAIQNPDQLNALLTQLPLTELDTDIVLTPLVRELFKHASTQGLALLKELPSTSYNLFYAGASSLVQYDLTSATQWLQELEDPEQKAAVAAAIAPYWVEQNMTAAQDWLSSQQDEVKQQVIHDYSAAMTQQNPAQTVQFLYETLDPAQALDVMRVSSTAAAWVEKEPEQALHWIEALPPSNEKIELINQASSQLTHQNVEHAVAWIGSLENDGERLEATYSMAYALSGTQQYANALNWLTSQGQTGTQDARIEGILEVWIADQQEQAEQWMTESDFLSAEQQQALIKKALNHN